MKRYKNEIMIAIVCLYASAIIASIVNIGATKKTFAIAFVPIILYFVILHIIQKIKKMNKEEEMK